MVNVAHRYDIFMHFLKKRASYAFVIALLAFHKYASLGLEGNKCDTVKDIYCGIKYSTYSAFYISAILKVPPF